MFAAEQHRIAFQSAIGIHPDELFGTDIDSLPEPKNYPDWFWQTIDDANASEEAFATLVRGFSQIKLIQMYILFQEAGGSLLRNEHLNYLDRNFPFEIEESDSDYTYAIVSRGSSFYSMVSTDPELLPIDPDTSFSPTFNDVIYQVYRDLYVLPVEERNGEPPHLFDVTENYKDYYMKLKQENRDD